MTGTAWTIREAGPDDMDSIRALYAEVWGYNRPRSFDHWRWFTSPDGKCPIALAMDGDRAAGFYTVWPAKLRLGSEVVLGGQSMDTMTHPDYQGQGMFVKLAQACYDLAAARGFEVLYGFPNPLSYPGFVRRLNWDHSGDIHHWIRPLRLSRHPRVPAALGPLADAAAALLPRGRTQGVEIAVGKPEPTALQGLLGQWCAERDVCRIDRNTAWLDWRYAPDAEHDYEWVCAHRAGTLVAAGAWGMQNAAWATVAEGRAHLVELLGGDRRGLQAVVAAIIGRAAKRSALLLETMCNVAPVAAVLRRAGFLRHRRAPFIVRGLTARTLGGNIHNHGAWRIMGGDVDTF